MGNAHLKIVYDIKLFLGLTFRIILKILFYAIIGITIFFIVVAIEICCIYAVKGDETYTYLRELWVLYKKLLYI